MTAVGRRPAVTRVRSTFTAVLMAAGVMVASPVVSGPANARPTANGESVLYAGQSLNGGFGSGSETLQSSSGGYELELVFQTVTVTQRLLVGNEYEFEQTWQTGDWRYAFALRLNMQTDGNLVLYRVSDNHVLWNSHTGGTGTQNSLHLQDDGNLVMYTSSGRVVWQSRSGPTMLGEGQVLLPGHGLTNETFSNDPTRQPMRLSMQTDGNLVIYHGTQPWWSTRTSVAGSRAVLQSNGDLVVYSPANRALWHTARYSSTPVALVLGPCQHPAVSIGDFHDLDLWHSPEPQIMCY